MEDYQQIMIRIPYRYIKLIKLTMWIQLTKYKYNIYLLISLVWDLNIVMIYY